MGSQPSFYDVVIVGGGHNGLACSIVLARHGLSCLVLEEKELLGGATKTEFAFPKVPGLATSTGSYLLGLMPPELFSKLGVQIPLIKRDPHYFLPTYGQKHLLLGQNEAEVKRQFLEFFSEDDFKANHALVTEIGKIRDDLAPSWLEEPLSMEETTQKYIRKELQTTFMDLVTKPIEHYLNRFHFKSELLYSMYAVTDAFSGLNASFGTQGAGFNFLVHNMCRLPGSDGTFMMVKGGMGNISKLFADKAQSLGVNILTHQRVANVDAGRRVTIEDIHTGFEREIQANAVVFNCDPFTTLDLLEGQLDPSFVEQTQKLKRNGTTMKVNLALKGLPKFISLPEAKGQHTTTIHLLPQAEDLKGQTLLNHIRKGYEDALNGKLPEFPTIEWYIHTPADPSLQDARGHHNSAFFVQWVPYEIEGSSWEKEEANYVKHLLQIADRFAPGTSDLVVDSYTLTPKKVERDFGIRYGHIHHIDNTFGFNKRFPYRLPIEGIYSCSAGTHPAGSVIGANGHNAAMCLLKDMGYVTTAH